MLSLKGRTLLSAQCCHKRGLHTAAGGTKGQRTRTASGRLGMDAVSRWHVLLREQQERRRQRVRICERPGERVMPPRPVSAVNEDPQPANERHGDWHRVHARLPPALGVPAERFWSPRFGR